MPSIRILFLASIFALSFASHTASAQTVVLPNTAASTEGNNFSSSAGGTLSTGAFTNQFLYTSSLLGTIPVGNQITGFRIRADGANATGTYPATSLVFTNYDVTLAQAAVSLSTFGSSSGATVANNMTNAQKVRSGTLTIGANSFTDNGSGPNPFGPLLSFDTPYVYQGGDLVLLISHSAAVGTGFSVDATSTGFGYGTAGSVFAQRISSSYNATTVGTTTAAPVIQLQFGPAAVPEPGSMALLAGLSVTGAAWLRRRRQTRSRRDEAVRRSPLSSE